MKKRYFVLGALLAMTSLFTLSSCDIENSLGNVVVSKKGSDENQESGTTETTETSNNQSSGTSGTTNETVDLASYKVTKEEFAAANNNYTYDNYKFVGKNYSNYISDATLSTTYTYTREGNWMAYQMDSYEFYYYIDNSHVTGYFISIGEVHSTSITMSSIDSIYVTYIDEIYSKLTFNESEKAYICSDNINLAISDTMNYTLSDLKFSFKDKKLIHMEEKVIITTNGTQSTSIGIMDCQYGNISVTVPQTILDYHNANYNK